MYVQSKLIYERNWVIFFINNKSINFIILENKSFINKVNKFFREHNHCIYNKINRNAVKFHWFAILSTLIISPEFDTFISPEYDTFISPECDTFISPEFDTFISP